jgi:hypothetical protein
MLFLGYLVRGIWTKEDPLIQIPRANKGRENIIITLVAISLNHFFNSIRKNLEI